MLFNSIEFAIFLFAVFLIYWFIVKKKHQWQNILLLGASYVFYGWWDWRFLSLIVISSFTDFFIGRMLELHEAKNHRRILLSISVVVNLGLLFFFKYYNFFVDSFIDLFSMFGMEISARTLNIILPVGISFYTFQTMSYTIDVYKREIKPSRNIVAFFAYVSFFPQLVAGPIERARNLLPQFEKKRVFDLQRASDGMRQMLWGLFKKIVIADNLAAHVDYAFSHWNELPGVILLLSIILFSIQIYADFSGYSDIAIGTARLLGFNLMQNFNYPYFSKNITEMWRRWHISLSTWLRDYLFMPLSFRFRYYGNWGVFLTILITFVLCGFWHGAKWTFIIFGLLQSIALTFEYLTSRSRKKVRRKTNKFIYNGLSLLLTFAVWQISMLVFRAHDLGNAYNIFIRLFEIQISDFNLNVINELLDNMAILKVAIFIPFLFAMEIKFRDKLHALEISSLNKWIRLSLYIFIAISILLFAPVEGGTFIYFQF